MRPKLRRNDQSVWVLASHNTSKINEIGAILEPYDIFLRSAADFRLSEPEETEPTFSGNALLKAQAACTATKLPALADDSGLCVEALGGRPGIHSARWAGEPRNFDRAMARIQNELEAAGTDDRRAAFVCVLALVRPDGRQRLYEGRVDGDIIWPPRGDSGFGYDPVFRPDGEMRVFAEMTRSEKARLSHRARALAAMVASEFAND
ncbi:MAG: non-canonical purine NTP pyrophosphatase [Hyphobacterium sp.]|nr:MAG: non-canonical purine NTP pyrophosphatase [Hyphobacterium sp.]